MNVKTVAITTDILVGTVFRQKPGFTLNMEVERSSTTLVTTHNLQGHNMNRTSSTLKFQMLQRKSNRALTPVTPLYIFTHFIYGCKVLRF
jgi:hypothetical protein